MGGEKMTDVLQKSDQNHPISVNRHHWMICLQKRKLLIQKIDHFSNRLMIRLQH